MGLENEEWDYKSGKTDYYRPSPTLLSLLRSNKQQVPSLEKQDRNFFDHLPTFEKWGSNPLLIQGKAHLQILLPHLYSLPHL